jgi:DHA3 family macrolide efflux protein-like MFS transporter
MESKFSLHSRAASKNTDWRNNVNIEKNWKNDIVLFLASQTVSLFGSSLVQYAIMWHITLETKSGLMMTISIICGFLPVFFLSPFAGVWADRYNRKILIMLSDSLIALCTLVIAILFFSGYKEIWILFAASSIRAFGSGIQTPAVGAFIPQMVPEDKLTKVMATNGSIQSMVTLLSPMASGALLTVTSIEMIFLIDVFTAVIAVVILLFLHVQPHKRALEKQEVGYLKDMKDGISYIQEHSFLKVFFMFMAAYYILVSPAAFLTPLQVTRTFGDDVWRLTAIEVIFSVGMMAGGLIMASWGGFKNKIHTITLSGLVMGVCSIALGVVPDFFFYILFMGMIGLVMPMFNTPSMVMLQEKVDGDFLGRVFSVMSMISSIMMPVAMLVFGPLSDKIKIEYLLIGTGMLIMILTVLFMKNNDLLEAGKQVAVQDGVNDEENNK